MTTAVLSYLPVRKFPNVVNWKTVCVFGAILAGLLLFIYTFFVISLINGTYSVKNYQEKIAGLSKESRALEVSFAETGFMETLAQKVGAMNFEKTAQVRYIQILDASVARAK